VTELRIAGKLSHSPFGPPTQRARSVTLPAARYVALHCRLPEIALLSLGWAWSGLGWLWVLWVLWVQCWQCHGISGNLGSWQQHDNTSNVNTVHDANEATTFSLFMQSINCHSVNHAH